MGKKRSGYDVTAVILGAQCWLLDGFTSAGNWNGWWVPHINCLDPSYLPIFVWTVSHSKTVRFRKVKCKSICQGLHYLKFQYLMYYTINSWMCRCANILCFGQLVWVHVTDKIKCEHESNCTIFNFLVFLPVCEWACQLWNITATGMLHHFLWHVSSMHIQHSCSAIVYICCSHSRGTQIQSCE